STSHVEPTGTPISAVENLCWRQISAIFRNDLPLHRNVLTHQPYPQIHIVASDIDKAEPILRSCAQHQWVRLGSAVHQQHQTQRRVLTGAENNCPVMLWIILVSGLQND